MVPSPLRVTLQPHGSVSMSVSVSVSVSVSGSGSGSVSGSYRDAQKMERYGHCSAGSSGCGASWTGFESHSRTCYRGSFRQVT